MSNFQISCDLLRIVTPALDKIYAISSSISFEEKEDQVTKTHVAMSEFYNNIPSPLRVPSAATKQVPPHVYQFNLLYQALKIMLHRPFIRGSPSMESLHSLQNSHLVHLQSATFSAIRVSYVINSFRNFYPLRRLSPIAVEGLVMASHIHLFNSKSSDEMLARRSNNLYSLNLHILNLMTPPGKESSRAVEVLTSLAQESGISTASDPAENLAPRSVVEPQENGSGGISHQIQAVSSVISDSNTAVELEEPSTVPDDSPHPESYFDWLDLPLSDQLLFDGAFSDVLCNDPCDQGHEYCGITNSTF
ncbi:fungal-specific transcription factor domain-containing protein [Penicillium canescens]|uniref:fungal-specific transcription factor domain-containing protein n=1 Tax=Penicillium canescens TaxID=5083 RepID=UPI0026DEA66B|nr:fungal-specific transcription factor domain-containing protein [Penicillium canescens]KAJ6019542.1 fungal-specific transcription factor domain-containing protein [Penicillium canescens]KAJ6058899.1 fungal-specific transcription factor domain-containing protein [Penicillium canescens]